LLLIKEKQGSFTPMKRFFQIFSIDMVARMLLVCLPTGIVFLFPTFVPRTQATVGANVTVNANGSQGIIPASAFGINEMVGDGSLLDSALPGLLTATGVKIICYPGDSLSDAYHWQSNTTGTRYANSIFLIPHLSA
jgi:hypothetical protein